MRNMASHGVQILLVPLLIFAFLGGKVGAVKHKNRCYSMSEEHVYHVHAVMNVSGKPYSVVGWCHTKGIKPYLSVFCPRHSSVEHVYTPRWSLARRRKASGCVGASGHATLSSAHLPTHRIYCDLESRIFFYGYIVGH